MAAPALLPRRRSRLPAVLQLAVAFWLAATSGCLCRAVPAPWFTSTGLFPPDYHPRTGPRPSCRYLPPPFCRRPHRTPHLPPPSSPPPPPPPPAVTPPPPPAPEHHFPPHCRGRFCPPRPPACAWKYDCGGGGGSPP
ncbi:hypothetical protein BS78_05G175000 [Paspalum vaginatum]|nr:hypothetical protein BS78_05G175000 [Paspalum vaginatum]